MNLIKKIDSIDGIILAIGIGALIIGVLVDIFLVRLLCLVFVLCSALLVFLLLRLKQSDSQTTVGNTISQFQSQQLNSEMKKLVFDDFQSDPGGRYFVKEIIQSQIPVEMDAVQTIGSSYTPAVSLLPDEGAVKIDTHANSYDFKISDFFDVESDIYKRESEPHTEFDFLLNKILVVIKEVLFAHTVAFFWANREKAQMVLEARISDSPNFITSRRFPMGHDLVSKVAESGKPESLTDVNPLSEGELLRYYNNPESIKSFLAVPVFCSKILEGHDFDKPVAVVVVDSKVQDDFGLETFSLLGKFTKLISALIKNYTEKYDLLLDSEVLKSIRRLQEKARNNFSLQTIIQSLAEEASRIINWDFLSIVLYDDTQHAWLVKKVTNRSHEEYLSLNQVIDFPISLVGQTIKNNVHCLVDDLSTNSSHRYFAGEKMIAKGTFLSIPISSLNKCYGALNVESRDVYNFSRQDIQILYRLTENAASALEFLFLNEIINEYVIVDNLTGVFSRKFFIQNMTGELERADDGGSELSMVFILVDKSNEIVDRYGHEGFGQVMITLAKAIRASVRTYDIVGRYDYRQFGILLVNTAANEAYIWAEKIRKNVAGHVINFEGKSFSITVSIGVCGALEGMTKEQLISNTSTVMNRAMESGGNNVRVF
ncbi:MAG TPA: diguanylate cyclase [Bacteroidota bacterium]|nr:diguanylate cyclase [Bacteroidota bacterium]